MRHGCTNDIDAVTTITFVILVIKGDDTEWNPSEDDELEMEMEKLDDEKMYGTGYVNINFNGCNANVR